VTVEVLDVAKPPEKKSRPHRLTMTAAAFLLSMAMGAGYAMLTKEEQARPVMRAVAAE